MNMNDVAREAIASRIGGTGLEQMQSAYAGLTLAVQRLQRVYDENREINGIGLPGPVQTQKILPMCIDEWACMLLDHDYGLANAVQDETDVTAGREPSGTAAWAEFQRRENDPNIDDIEAVENGDQRQREL